MASNDSSLDINGSGGGGSGGGSHGYLGFSNEKSVRSSNVSPGGYEQLKSQHFDPIYEHNSLRQMEYYRLGNQRIDLEFDNTKKDDINVRELLENHKQLKMMYCNCRADNEKLLKELDLYKSKCSENLKTSNDNKELYQQLKKKLDKTRMEKLDLENTLKTRETQMMQVSSELEAHKHELTIIHSERDTVLKENQKFAEENTMTMSQNKLLEKENKHLRYENECLKSRIGEAYANIESLKKQLDYIKNRPEFKSMSNEFNGNGDFSDTKNKYNSNSQQTELDLQVANQEIEKLKKSLDKATSEVAKAAQEINEAKGRRDWAISSRERIVGERDSIKTLCDELRKERDKAVSDLLAAFRDIEEIKKQKDEACKEIEQLREQFESQLTTTTTTTNTNNTKNDINHNTSNVDSEILKKFDTELIEMNMSEFSLNDDDFGITLQDNRDDMQNIKNTNITVANVSKESIFNDKLQKNDIILQVNRLDCSKVPKRYVLDEIRACSNHCSTLTMIVRRQRSIKRHVYTAQVHLDSNRNHGLTLQSGIYISKIANGSPASTNENLSIGDRILSINNHSVENVSSSNEAISYLDDTRSNMITIIGMKQILVQNNKPKIKSSNTSTQTDDNLNLNHSIELESNCHFVPTTNPYLESPTSISPISTPAKSTSLLTGMLQKFRGKINQKSNEADAIAVLDSVLKDDLLSNVPTKDNVIKRSKKKNKESMSSKEIAKSMGTWPKANIIAHDNNIGTIIHPRRRKERPPLSTFTETLIDKNKFDINEDYFNTRNRNTSNHIQPIKPPTQPMNNRSNTINRPVSYLNPSPPPNYTNRHTLCYIDNKSVPFSTTSGLSTLSRFTKLNEFDHTRHRMSLNITPNENNVLYNINKSQAANLFKTTNTTSQQQKQNSLDFILRSQNSIESFLGPKSPLPLEFTHKLPTSKDQLDYMISHHQTMNKNQSKYPSDSESLGPPDLMHSGIHSNNSITSQSMVYSPKSISLYPQYTHQTHSHQYHPTTRLSSPSTLPGSQTGDNLGLGIYDRCGFESYTPSSYHHSHGASIDYPIGIERNPIGRERDDILTNYPNGHFRYEGGTFPKKKENPRLRIPSNQSVTSKGSGVKNSTGSIELHGSERGSPMPIYKVEILSHGSNTNKINSMPDYVYGQKPNLGDLRRVTIDKSNEPLGITIRCNKNGGGIFVQTVTENSIASQVGLQVGDQLLEICGINMRAATYEGASRVLCQCGNPITMLVQYNPDKYDGEIEQSSDDQSVSHSGSPTPRNSPRPTRTHLLNSSTNKSALTQTLPKNLTIPSKFQGKENLDKKNDNTGTFNRNSSILEEDPRVLFIETNKSANLGIRLVGGNAFGIFVDSIKEDNLAYNAGLKVGDQILEYNGSDLRHATAEHAAYELAKPADDKVTVVVQYNYKKYSQIRDLPGGDSFYIRVGFDRTGDLGDSQLRFVKDEVLYVDNTIFRPGEWRAWKLDDAGHLLLCGIIPSQLKVEEELRLHGDISDGDATTRRGSTSARRSFFRRKKHHRSSSRDSKELASFSNTQLSWHSDSGMLSDELALQCYQKVERLDYTARRPVLVLGPLSNWVVDKLTIDFASQFKCCPLTPMNCELETIENMLKNNFIIDYKRHNNIFEMTTVKAIKEVCETNRHCILDISLAAVERMQRLQIFPIVLLLRFKSAKQIKEIKDSRYASDKISAKAAKEMYEHSLKLFNEYKHLISDAIPAGVNITHICTQIKDAVEKEQKQIIWVPSPTI